ncbi:MAG: hypothetical protein QM779_15490 [Propionicimonas sp.]|uniref:hypothetical protein n=1 Tax=Propionicimonas sp. TaxID=1955623 RepID=UPI003D14ACC3
MTEPLALALGHVRNAVWQLMGNNQPDGLTLGLECLDLEAILNPADTEPGVVPCEATPAQSLAAARSVLEQIPDQVAPAAWAVLTSLTAKMG